MSVQYFVSEIPNFNSDLSFWVHTSCKSLSAAKRVSTMKACIPSFIPVVGVLRDPSDPESFDFLTIAVRLSDGRWYDFPEVLR